MSPDNPLWTSSGLTESVGTESVTDAATIASSRRRADEAWKDALTGDMPAQDSPEVVHGGVGYFKIVHVDLVAFL